MSQEGKASNENSKHLNSSINIQKRGEKRQEWNQAAERGYACVLTKHIIHSCVEYRPFSKCYKLFDNDALLFYFSLLLFLFFAPLVLATNIRLLFCMVLCFCTRKSNEKCYDSSSLSCFFSCVDGVKSI